MNSMGINDFSATLALGGAALDPADKTYYLTAQAGGNFGVGGTSLDLMGAFFVGQGCDPDLFAFYPEFPFPPGPGELRRGLVVYMEGKAPLLSSGCLFEVEVGMKAGAYALGDAANNPFFGGKLGGSISGEVLCLVKATGGIDLAYGYGGGVHRFDGSAEAKFKIGIKPLQISKSKSFIVIYEKPTGGSGSWDVNP